MAIVCDDNNPELLAMVSKPQKNFSLRYYATFNF